MVEVFHDLVGGRFEVSEIDQQSDVVQLLAPSVDLDLVIVPVQVLALPLIPAQLVRGREIAFDHYFVECRHITGCPELLLESPCWHRDFSLPPRMKVLERIYYTPLS